MDTTRLRTLPKFNCTSVCWPAGSCSTTFSSLEEPRLRMDPSRRLNRARPARSVRSRSFQATSSLSLSVLLLRWAAGTMAVTCPAAGCSAGAPASNGSTETRDANTTANTRWPAPWLPRLVMAYSPVNLLVTFGSTQHSATFSAQIQGYARVQPGTENRPHPPTKLDAHRRPGVYENLCTEYGEILCAQLTLQILGDLAAVEASILDEDLAGGGAGHDHPGQINARDVAF